MPMLNLIQLVKIARSECYMLSLHTEQHKGLNWEKRKKMAERAEKLIRKASEILEEEQFQRVFYHDGEKWVNSHAEKKGDES